MTELFDVAVIGSGFGGAVTRVPPGARRLPRPRARARPALDAGREFPAPARRPVALGPRQPERRNGWFDLRVFPNMTVVAGAGVGGGSLVYANISVDAKRDTFDERLAAPRSRTTTLAPHYARVAAMMDVQQVPTTSGRSARELMKEAAEQAGTASGSGRSISP